MDAPAECRGLLWRTFHGEGGPAILGAIVGSLVTGVIAVSATWIQEANENSRFAAQLDEENRDEQAELRHAAYDAYLDAAEAFKFYAIDRVTTCKPGTDEPLNEGQPCTVELMTTYQAARYDVQDAVNEVHRVGSDEGIAAMQTIARSLPSTLGAGLSVPEEEMPDSVTFSRGYIELSDVMTCETNPVVPSSCPQASE